MVVIIKAGLIYEINKQKRRYNLINIIFIYELFIIFLNYGIIMEKFEHYLIIRALYLTQFVFNIFR